MLALVVVGCAWPAAAAAEEVPPVILQPLEGAHTLGAPAFSGTSDGTENPVTLVIHEGPTATGATVDELGAPVSQEGTWELAPPLLGEGIYTAVALEQNSSAEELASAPVTFTVDAAPAVTQQPANETVTAGEPASFTAAASGTPTPSVQWEISIDGGKTWLPDLFDSGASSDTLSIAHATALQNGYEYRAVFENSRGEVASEPATLEVQTAPAVTVQPESTAVAAGSQAKFKAAAEGIPAPSVTWEVSTDGGATWAADLVDSGATSDTLTIAHASPLQNGYRYRAVFENGVGTVTSDAAALEVQTAPVVSEQPVSAAVHAGEAAEFTAAASGRPQPQVQWQVSTNLGKSWSNDLSDAGATSETLTVSSKASENGYEYRAVFTNVVAKVPSEPATLIVSEAEVEPTVVEQPADQSVVEGEGASFSARAEGSPSPSVQWEHSGNHGASWSADTTDKGTKTDSLLITSAVMAESGEQYRAVFTNASGSTTSHPAELTVAPKPAAPVVLTPPHSLIVTAGHPASFSASATGVPTPEVQWQVRAEEAQPWRNDTTDPGNTGGTLTISSAEASQNGWEYRAVFDNGVGEPAHSAIATLTVDTLPSVAAPPHEQTRVVGETAVFSVEPSGSPSPALQWEVSTNKGANWSADKTDLDTTSPTMTVQKVSLADSGYEYRVHLSNRAGQTTTAPAALKVSEDPIAPVVLTQPSDVTVLAGQAAAFFADATGYPTPEVSWEVSTDGGVSWHADTTDTGTDTTTLIIPLAAPGQNGWEYRADFSNGDGDPVKSAPATLTVDTAPAVTVAPLDVAVQEGQPATFTAAASGRPAPEVSWQVSTDGGTTWMADTTDGGNATNVLAIAAATSAQNGYQYRAAFTNSAGEAVTSAATLTVTRPPSAPSPPGPPVASFTWFPLHPNTGEPVSLVSTSSDAFAAINSFAWDPTGSGSLLPGSAVMTTTFATAGVHAVTLRVGDSNGNSAAVTEPITVTKPALALMQPFPVVRIAGSDTSTGAKLTLVTVLAPVGATVSVSCHGGGCPPHTETKAVRAGSGAGGGALLTFRNFQRRLRAGAVLQIRITHAGEIGKYTRFTIRHGHLPVRVDACIDPSVAVPIACPVS